MRGLLCVCMALCLAPCLVAAAQEQHRYREITGDRSTAFDWSMERRSDAIHIVASEPDRRFLTVCDPDGATARWQLDDAEQQIRAERHGERLLLRGTRNGAPYAEDFALDGAPWFQAMSFSLRAWLAGTADSVTFWTLRPDTLEPVKLRAQRLGNRSVETAIGTMEAFHVRVRADGLLAAVWKADYWFRASDRLFVKYQAVNGLPGTPPTTIELLPNPGIAATPPATRFDATAN